MAPKGRERLRKKEREERIEERRGEEGMRGDTKRFYKSMEVWMLLQPKL